MEPFHELVRLLTNAGARFVVIGVGGANYYALRGSMSFTTKDRDLFLPRDPDNELRVWEACAAFGMELWTGDEPLGEPRDRWLAERIVERRMLVTAINRAGLAVDLTLVMADFEFEPVWNARRVFMVEDVYIPVARLSDIVESKRRAGRDKDLLFLATHEQALRDLLGEDD